MRKKAKKPANSRRSPALIDKSDPNRHARERHRLLYGVEKMEVNEDYAGALARKTWPRYKVLPDGRQGPLPFETVSEKKEFERRYGVKEF